MVIIDTACCEIFSDSSTPCSMEGGMKLKAIIRRYAKGVARRDAARVTKACRCDTQDMYGTSSCQHGLDPVLMSSKKNINNLKIFDVSTEAPPKTRPAVQHGSLERGIISF